MRGNDMSTYERAQTCVAATRQQPCLDAAHMLCAPHFARRFTRVSSENIALAYRPSGLCSCALHAGRDDFHSSEQEEY